MCESRTIICKLIDSFCICKSNQLIRKYLLEIDFHDL